MTLRVDVWMAVLACGLVVFDACAAGVCGLLLLTIDRPVILPQIIRGFESSVVGELPLKAKQMDLRARLLEQ